jgi:hypothetical protein
MRFFSIKILILCILLPPLIYLLTVIALEGRIQAKLARGIEEICTGDPRPLLDGSLRLRDAIRANVEAYLRSSVVIRYGISVRVQISSRGGTVLYPPFFEDSGQFQSASNPLRVAQQNFTLLNEDDLILEIETMEKKLLGNLELRNIQQQEIQALKEVLADNEKEQRREDRARSKAEEVIRKRLATLYKNLLINDRAVQGMAALNEDLRLKAEEIIYQLNYAPDLVTIKRKVFGKKNRETVLEVVFAYKGRLYFRRGADRRVEVVAIGTKNTQERELDFLSSLRVDESLKEPFPSTQGLNGFNDFFLPATPSHAGPVRSARRACPKPSQHPLRSPRLRGARPSR